MSRSAYYLSLTAFVASLSACGGGSGGGSPGTPGGTTSTVQPQLAISSGNAEVATGEVVDTGSTAIGGGSIGSDAVTGVQLNVGQGSGLNQIARWSIEQIRSHRGQLLAAVSAVVVNTTENCTGGGSVALSWNDADDNNDLSTGDSFSLSFNNCVEDGMRLSSGTIGLSNLVLNGDPSVMGPWSLSASLSFASVQISEGGQTARINGDMSIAAQTTDGVTVSSTVSGTTLSISENSVVKSLRNFNFSYQENQNTLAFSLNYSGTLDIGRLSGRVSFQTSTPFTGTDIINSWPTDGVLVMTGANNATITLTAQGGDAVRLDLDTNGDSAVDQTINTTWTALATI